MTTNVVANLGLMIQISQFFDLFLITEYDYEIYIKKNFGAKPQRLDPGLTIV